MLIRRESRKVCKEGFSFDVSKVGVNKREFKGLFDEWLEDLSEDDYIKIADYVEYNSPATMMDSLKGKPDLYYSFLTFVFNRAIETVDF
jgi:hypothetical protein